MRVESVFSEAKSKNLQNRPKTSPTKILVEGKVLVRAPDLGEDRLDVPLNPKAL